jgi:hypothetical protein
MIIKTNNGDINFQVKELDFTNVACDIEDYGVNVMSLFTGDDDVKGFSMCRAIIGVITGEKDKQKAGRMLTEHLKNGGSLDDIFNTFKEAMQSAGFGKATEEATAAEEAKPTIEMMPVQTIETKA